MDLESEQTAKLNQKIEKAQEKNKTTMSEIASLENQIKKLDKEISEINSKKKLCLEEAMETKDKWISVETKKVHTFQRITRFFANKFNTSKVITKTVIMPLQYRINEFKTTELADLKE
jgi:septal ring factor EnvC (AmiA/AmiB activator)